MKPIIIGVNLGDYGSTGNMMIHALEYANKHGGFDYLVMTPYRTDRGPCVPYGERKRSFFEWIAFYFLRKWGWAIDGDYYRSRSKLIVDTIREQMKNGRKVIVHLHNIHHANLDAPYLLRALSKIDVPILYTLHDCWSFTGGCYYYEEAKCDGFKDGCRHCLKRIRWASFRCAQKIKPLVKAKNFVLLPCSKWLDKEIRATALAHLPRIVVNGETSLEPVLPSEGFVSSLGLPNGSKILISVSKGARHLRRLASILPENYYLFVVGDGIDSSPDGHLIALGFLNHETYRHYLANADCFVSVTPEDNLPLALMEAQISGVPVVGFGHGGTSELITDGTGVMTGLDDDVTALLTAIKHVVEEKPFRREDIIKNGQQYSKFEYAKRMLPLYYSALGETK